MKRKYDPYKEIMFKRIGPGGWKCYCCGPMKLVDKLKLRRNARRLLKMMDNKKFRSGVFHG